MFRIGWGVGGEKVAADSMWSRVGAPLTFLQLVFSDLERFLFDFSRHSGRYPCPFVNFFSPAALLRGGCGRFAAFFWLAQEVKLYH